MPLEMVLNGCKMQNSLPRDVIVLSKSIYEFKFLETVANLISRRSVAFDYRRPLPNHRENAYRAEYLYRAFLLGYSVTRRYYFACSHAAGGQ